MIIPLKSGLAFFKFSVVLSQRSFKFEMHWSTRYKHYSVNILEDGDLIIAGRGLHPDIDLFHGLNLGVGKVYLQGKPPTVQNLGVSNKLVYEP